MSLDLQSSWCFFRLSLLRYFLPQAGHMYIGYITSFWSLGASHRTRWSFSSLLSLSLAPQYGYSRHNAFFWVCSFPIGTSMKLNAAIPYFYARTANGSSVSIFLAISAIAFASCRMVSFLPLRNVHGTSEPVSRHLLLLGQSESLFSPALFM